MLETMARAKNIRDLGGLKEEVKTIYRETWKSTVSRPKNDGYRFSPDKPADLSHRCIEGAAVQAYQQHGVAIAPGMKIQYVVTDARRYRLNRYGVQIHLMSLSPKLRIKAWAEIAFAFPMRAGVINNTSSPSSRRLS